jgi:hypothetical protein
MLANLQRRQLLRLTILHFLAVLGGCATLSPVPHADGQAIVLRVENGRYEDVTVYLVRGGVPVRLGIVEGLRARTFTLMPGEVGTGTALSLRAVAVRSHAAVHSEPFQLHDARTIAWLLRSGAALPSLVVR